ncbi:lysine transporter LysE [Zymomonas mobilis subsp. mobilis ZM4 = ATCC 31821]|uniref:Lysine exporter protein (LYSE/YGGA) n=2 Tax=Zymomonas mobilis subsp. mobilis TaxID=120045 RepID=Q5NMJ9_ZYMMO|nr:LysE family translocator [Zymomonas mobilis]AAV90061.1 Lysine exporter protein (LYSE/YGGA) [Zymomonas mobilis subsp. mobilis ZM4 = ATCC 31821]ACV76286.1 Lysine exporter protein (LYSE/YGGA) [Zymomonas mobilis subsp. mobilis NCIMB 11163]AEH63486.1 Lysine exporter protein (LYSE/YGGA) [Zymomonas mobilis subsp. mobilis ATCC 10988]AFN57503.1 Lysine exporter protein (LYSE/YGGA) [Zymomonas mobilis subsp. mobilis ATCC 29191]AHB10964.1 putative threonine efflux protein [Zymomonas mobilis subsp. mobil
MPIEILVAFWAVSVLFVVIPGADWAYVLSVGTNHKSIVAAVFGLVLGYVAATILVAIGAAALIAKTPFALDFLTCAGAIYLFLLGIGLLRHPPVLQDETFSVAQKASYSQWIKKGFCVSGLNPKMFLFFLMFLPQFTSAKADWPFSIQILALGIVHTFNCGSIYLLIGFLARALLKKYPHINLALSRFSAVSMMTISIILLVERYILGEM